MQPYFKNSCHNELQKAIIDQITIAKNNNLPIIFVEYDDCGPIHTELLRHTNSYKNVHNVIKSQDDGSNNLENYWSEKAGTKIFYRNLVVCGVNTDACVYLTVEGLLNCEIPIFKVTIPVNCCNNGSYHASIDEVKDNKYSPFFYLSRLAKVKLV